MKASLKKAQKKWYEKYGRANHRQWYKKNRKKALAIARKHYRENKATILRRYKEWYYGGGKEWQKKYWMKHPEFWVTTQHRRRAHLQKAEGNHTTKEWLEILKHSKGVCVGCCRHVGKKALTRDHIIPLSRGGSNYIINIQPLCKSCNSRKKDGI